MKTLKQTIEEHTVLKLKYVKISIIPTTLIWQYTKPYDNYSGYSHLDNMVQYDKMDYLRTRINGEDIIITVTPAENDTGDIKKIFSTIE